MFDSDMEEGKWPNLYAISYKQNEGSITYEIAYLDGFIEKGYDITPADVAYKWLELISDGYSAEKTAIENLRRGLLPPESGTTNNYFYDWIGAQMRTPLHGMLAPGNPKLAVSLTPEISPSAS